MNEKPLIDYIAIGDEEAVNNLVSKYEQTGKHPVSLFIYHDSSKEGIAMSVGIKTALQEYGLSIVAENGKRDEHLIVPGTPPKQGLNQNYWIKPQHDSLDTWVNYWSNHLETEPRRDIHTPVGAIEHHIYIAPEALLTALHARGQRFHQSSYRGNLHVVPRENSLEGELEKTG